MPDLLVQKFLRSSSIEQLEQRYAVKSKRHGTFPNLVLFKYSQTDSPMGEPIVQECRGVILDEADDWRVASFPFRKFFNHGEGHAATIDWKTASVYEKLDGSLIQLYRYRGLWEIATSGTPDASGPVSGFPGSFRDLFWLVANRNGWMLPYGYEAGHHTFLFELLTPHNRIVCQQPQMRIVLHGVRDNRTFDERPIEGFAKEFHWECVKSFPLGSIEACLESAKAINPMNEEGYVVIDGSFNRIKVKSPQYVALAHMKEGMGGRHLLEIVRTNEGNEFLTYFPEWANAHSKLRSEFGILCAVLEEVFGEIKGISSQKEFAEHATRTRCPAALFSIRKGNHQSVRQFFSTVNLNVVEHAVGMDLSALLPAVREIAA